MQEYIDAVNLDVMITEVGIFVAGFAAVLGIWLERDHSKPPRYAWWLSVLIVLATFVGMFQTLADAKEGAKLEADMARMLATLDKIAQNSDVEIPELNEFVKNEVSAQARANPDVVKKVAQRVADEGGDPAEMLGSYLPPSEVESVARKGALTLKAPKVKAPPPAGGEAKEGEAATAENKPKRRKLEFGGKSKIRTPGGDDDKGGDKAKDGDDDGPKKIKIGGRDDDDKKDDKDAKDGDDAKKDDDKDGKKLSLGGKDDDKKDDKKDDKAAGGPKSIGGGLGGKPGGAATGGAPAAGGAPKPGAPGAPAPGGVKGGLPKKP